MTVRNDGENDGVRMAVSCASPVAWQRRKLVIAVLAALGAMHANAEKVGTTVQIECDVANLQEVERLCMMSEPGPAPADADVDGEIKREIEVDLQNEIVELVGQQEELGLTGTWRELDKRIGMHLGSFEPRDARFAKGVRRSMRSLVYDPDTHTAGLLFQAKKKWVAVPGVEAGMANMEHTDAGGDNDGMAFAKEIVAYAHAIEIEMKDLRNTWDGKPGFEEVLNGKSPRNLLDSILNDIEDIQKKMFKQVP